MFTIPLNPLARIEFPPKQVRSGPSEGFVCLYVLFVRWRGRWGSLETIKVTVDLSPVKVLRSQHPTCE